MIPRPILPLLLLLASGCRTATDAGDRLGLASASVGPNAGPQAAPADRTASETQAMAAIRDRRYAEARDILAGLLVADSISEAERHLAEGRARDALLPLDVAIELRPANARAQFLRGRAAFETAPTDTQPQFFYEDALGNFEEAARRGYGVEALLAASRAARLVPKPDRALELVRLGAEVVAAMEEPPEIEVPLERTWAEASFDVYRARKVAEEDATELFAETENQLERLVGRVPEDPWPYAQLANLYQWEGRVSDAVERQERALALVPDDPGQHERLVGLLRAEGGRDAVVGRYRRFREQYPSSALGAWYLAFESFHTALDAFENGEHDPQAFEEVEASFRACRELEPNYGASCKGYEVVCRNAIGWCHYNAGDLQAAKAAFFSMEDLMEGGLTWALRERDAESGEMIDRLPDGVAGLDFVTRAYSSDVDDRDGQVNAAAIADYLHAYRADDGDLANNAGFLNRDAAVLFEQDAGSARHRASLETDEAKKAEYEKEAARLRARAQELMERSYAAYQKAAAIAPNDVRVVNDTGLIMAYFLRTDVAEAEHYLMRSVADGKEQLEDTTLEGTELDDLVEAWGDAHQNLGILYLTLTNEPARAKEWIEKSLEIGPASREQLRPLLDLCDRLVAGEATDLGFAGRMVWMHNPKK